MSRPQKVSALVEQIYDAVVDPRHWRTTLENLAICGGARSACLLTFDGRLHRLETIHCGFDEAALSSFNLQFGSIDPVLPNLASVPGCDTKAEASVAERVAKGIVLQSVADELGISLSTVRTHLHRVFEKTYTNRQTELIKLLRDAELLNCATEALFGIHEERRWSH